MFLLYPVNKDKIHANNAAHSVINSVMGKVNHNDKKIASIEG